MAGAVIYELKDERGYGVSLQDVADALGLPNRESIQFYRTHEKLSKLVANEPYKKACPHIHVFPNNETEKVQFGTSG